MSEMVETKVSSTTLKSAIRAKFGKSGHQVFYEVGNDTGARVTRHADAVSIGIWPSTGHAVHGFEIKVSRSDWLREKDDPGKSLPIFRFCHRWSLVTPQGLVKPDELPPGWGLYELRGDTLREVAMPARMTPEQMTPGFVAALVRRAGEMDGALIAAAVEKERRQWYASRDAEIDRLVERRIRDAGAENSRAVKKLAELEAALGEPISSAWDLQPLAAAIKHVRRCGVVGTYDGLAGILSSLKTVHGKIEAALREAGLDQDATLSEHPE